MHSASVSPPTALLMASLGSASVGSADSCISFVAASVKVVHPVELPGTASNCCT